MVDGSIPGSGDLESPELRRSHAGLAQSRAARPRPLRDERGSAGGGGRGAGDMECFLWNTERLEDDGMGRD